MTQEYYRGGSRSAFESMITTGDLVLSQGVAVVPIAAAVGTMLRLKRIQVQLQMVLSTGQGHAWAAFLRVPQGFAPTYDNLTPGDPTTLRPKPMLLNADHATYWDFYLEAINVDSGGALLFVVRSTGVPAQGNTFSVRYTSERQVG